MRIKSQVLKIRACITAQVAVLQPEWRSHECCNTATSAVIHASIFNTWLLILKYLYYLFIHNIPKKQSIFQCWTLLINTECSRIFQCMVCINKYGIFQVLIFLKNCVFLHKIMHQTQILKKSILEIYRIYWCRPCIAKYVNIAYWWGGVSIEKYLVFWYTKNK